MIKFQYKPFSFYLKQPLETSQNIIKCKHGWLMRLENSRGDVGWGEVSPWSKEDLSRCETILSELKEEISINQLEIEMKNWPGALEFGCGSCIAEMQKDIGYRDSRMKWKESPDSAVIITKDNEINSINKHIRGGRSKYTFKWKVGIKSNQSEEDLLKQIISTLPNNSLLRIDPNGAWSRRQALSWAENLFNEPKLEWIEQPFAANDIEGHLDLSHKVPIALDESLLLYPELRRDWKQWQIRRPSLEGDPRKLLKELNINSSYKMISTAFETGIGRRWINHFAGIISEGITPTAPGLAPGLFPSNNLFRLEPELVWEAA
tara:strand:+ start:19932 stop:20888 length:957 start_codon:yes stop_codon:yes gene_type:complete